MSKKKMKNELLDQHEVFGIRANEILNIIARFRYSDDCIDCLYEKVRNELSHHDLFICHSIKEYDEDYRDIKVGD